MIGFLFQLREVHVGPFVGADYLGPILIHVKELVPRHRDRMKHPDRPSGGEREGY